MTPKLSVMGPLLILVLCLFFIPFTAKAQVVITGRVTGAASGAPLYPATVLDKTSGQAVYADTKGYYRIEVQPGDQLQYSYLGFYTLKYSVPLRLTRVIHDVQLVSKREHLSEVEVHAKTPYQQDSLDRLRTFGDYLKEPVYPLMDKSSHSNGGFGLTFHPFTYFSKDQRRKRRFHKMYGKFEKKAFMDARYTPELVTRLTGLTGDSLQQFLQRFHPTYGFTRHATDLEFWSWIKIQYQSWIMPK
ncbi:MAG TPA: carboxypeptidase-like regulatory domain-containing protein [Chitinophagaceae bacterium]|nr:carboxypeptidase-like regulatory domain-containing protein [Chitinophagaceae bacterium]